MTTVTASRPTAREMAVKSNTRAEVAAPQTTAEEVQAIIQAKADAALEKAIVKMQQSQQEVAEPEGWWNLYALGPIQPIAFGGPLLPHQVIKMGEPAFIATVLFLNPFHYLSPGTSAADILANFALPYEVQYATGNLTTWSLGPASLQAVHSGAGYNLSPGTYVYVDVLGFVASSPGIYEMNISARILGATPPHVNAPQFAGFARAVVDLDPDLFISGPPGLQFDQSIRFQVYP